MTITSIMKIMVTSSLIAIVSKAGLFPPFQLLLARPLPTNLQVT